MGSICATPDENQLEGRAPEDKPLVLWSDITNSETRVIMTLLTLAKVRYEFQQVATPVEAAHVDEGGVSQLTTQLHKENYLEVPDDPSQLARRKKPITGRSVYVGDREAFFKYISMNYEDIGPQLMPPEQAKRMNQCLGWHKAIMQPAIKRLIAAKQSL